MALKRATKSIPLSGGVVEEIDDFLLEPNGMQYMENLRYTKTDTAEKRRPLGTAVATGASNYTANTYGVWSQGNTVGVVANNEVSLSRDNGSTWETTPQNTDLLGIESIVRSAEQAGGSNYSWAPCGNMSGNNYNISFYVIAFERITMITSTITNSREVIVQVVDLEGQLIEETAFANRCAPKVKPADDFTTVMMVNASTGDIEGYTVPSTGVGAGELSTLAFSEAADVQLYCQQYNHQTFPDETYGPNGGTTLAPEDMRLGYSRLLTYNNAAFDSYNQQDSLFGCIAWKDVVAEGIKIRRTSLGVPTGSVATVSTDFDVGATNLYVKLLDVYSGVSEIYVLWAEVDVSAGANQTDIWFSVYNASTMAQIGTDIAVASNQNAEVVNGSVRLDSASSAWIGCTFASGNPDDGMDVSAGLHRVSWYKILNTGAIDETGNLFSHRMCSDVAISKDDHAYFVAQQWDNWNPGPGGTTPYTDVDQPAFTPTHKKPVTSILVCMNRGTKLDPIKNAVIGTFDAGQSKACLPGEDEQSIHMSGDLYYHDNQSSGSDGYHNFWYGNRVLLTATDDFYYATDNPSTSVLAYFSDGKQTLHSGSSRFACYRLHSSIYVATQNYTNGMFMGTSCPSWFDGSTELCSMQPLDSPEIVSWVGQGDMGDFLMYQPINAQDKVIQVVVGYYDDSGLIHRSAPSSLVYMGNMTQVSGTTGNWIKVFVTPPLGLARGRKYFVEAYEASTGGTPQLAATRHIATNDATQTVSIEWESILRPSPVGAAVYDISDFRASKTIYTAGGVLAADPWPNFDAVVSSGRRLFAHSISDPSAIYYSKIFENGVAPEFSAALVISIGNEKITALGAIDDKVLAFTATGIWMIYGTGPDNTGANGDFFVEKLTFPAGCTDQDSILTYEEGIAFYSSTTNEFHVIGRDLQLADIGENVKDMSSSITDVRCAIGAPYDHELRWYCSQTTGNEFVLPSAELPAQPPRPFINNQTPTDPVFVYNYKYKKWSIWSEDGANFSRVVINNNRVGGVTSSFTFRTENDTEWLFSPYCKWETPWIKVNQLQDFGRFYGLTFIGKFLSSWQDNGTGVEAGDLKVTVAYDYEGATREEDEYLFRANQDFKVEDGDRLQFRVRPKRQKCQAIKIYVEEQATAAVELWEPTYTPGQGYVLTAVDVHYGAKGGSGDKSLGSLRRKG